MLRNDDEEGSSGHRKVDRVCLAHMDVERVGFQD
jgi:hypothetical protein